MPRWSIALLSIVVACGPRSVKVDGDPDDPEPEDLPVAKAKALALGVAHSCVLTTAGDVRCWGDDTNGESSPPEGRFTQISALYRHTCGIREDGTVACWGRDTWGETAPPTDTFKQVSAGLSHTCGIRTDGTLRCWGFDGWGETEPPSGTYQEVVSGSTHSCALRDDGTVTCWGRYEGEGSYYDGLGPDNLPRMIDTNMPTGPFVTLSAAEHLTCGLRSDGTTECWGERARFCGLHETGVFEISAGTDWTCGLDKDHSLVCSFCGSPIVWTKGPPLGKFQHVTVGWSHGCAIRNDGVVECWGFDDHGQATPP